MKVFAISDLHLSFLVPPNNNWENVSVSKPMDIFGAAWQDSYKRLYQNWIASVTSDDFVLVAGDISWAMTLTEAAADFAFLGSLPGQIIMIKGNHDYWWQSISRVRQSLPSNCKAMQNDSIVVGSRVICGTRGWILPESNTFTAHDNQIYARELLRLRLSLESGKKSGLEPVVMTHFPPLATNTQDSEFCRIMHEFGVSLCIYGHTHNAAVSIGFEGEYQGISLLNTTIDYLKCQPLLLWEE